MTFNTKQIIAGAVVAEAAAALRLQATLDSKLATDHGEPKFDTVFIEGKSEEAKEKQKLIKKIEKMTGKNPNLQISNLEQLKKKLAKHQKAKERNEVIAKIEKLYKDHDAKVTKMGIKLDPFNPDGQTLEQLEKVLHELETDSQEIKKTQEQIDAHLAKIKLRDHVKVTLLKSKDVEDVAVLKVDPRFCTLSLDEINKIVKDAKTKQ